MKPVVANRLIELNRQFYQTFGADFSATRGRIQAGVRRILGQLSGSESLLDLGCGNGNLERELARLGHRGPVLGLDFSPPLLEAARSGPRRFPLRFAQADLTQNWGEVAASNVGCLPLPDGLFDTAAAFAVLHHLPGEDLRLAFCREVARWLRPGGRFFLSNWQFLNSERLRARIHPWSLIGLSEEEVDPGDYLLDWRAGGLGLRYVHYFEAAELSALANASGFSVIETFYSDGQNGKLGLYQVWKKAEG